MAELSSNAVPFEVLDDADNPARIGMELEVYAYDDPFTPIDVIPYRSGLNAVDGVEGPRARAFQHFCNVPKVLE